MSTAPNDSSTAVIKTDSEHNGWQNTSYCPSVNSSDFGHYFVSALLPHVKSFAYTWFHLQAAKRKHFKSEDKRMSFEEEQSIKTRLTNEPASAKIKWAVRLLMKLRKDIHKDFQSKLVDVIASSGSINGHNHQVDEGHCVVSNPDMKGKMRRIDCLRQSDKVWRLDLVMVVLFKGIPLESSDGERIDKLAQCRTPQLCINPNHALLNVRDLEVFLANYVNTSSASLNGSLMNLNSGKLSCNNNIFSPSVFTPQEFLNLSEIPITQGASDSEIKNSLSYVSSNTYCNEANEDAENGMPSLVGGGEHNDEENKDALRSLISQTAHERRNSTDSSTTAAVKNKDKSLSPSSSSQQQQQHTPKTKKMKLSNKNQDQVSSSATPTRSSNIKINEIIMQQQQQRILASTAAATNGTTPNLVKIDFDLNNHQRETQQQQEIESQTQSSGSKSKKKAANNAEEKTAGAVKRRRSSQQQKAAAVENGENNNDTSTTPKVARKNSKAKKEQQENESAPKQHQQMSLLVEDQSSSSTNMSQQDEEIKELLLINKNKIAPPQQQQQSASQQVVVSDTTTATEKLKLAAAEMMGAFHHHQHHNHLQHLHQQQQQPQIQNHHHIIHHYQSHVINAAPGSNAQIDANMSYGFVAANPNQKDEKEKQATADLFLQLLKAKEENQTSSSATSATTASSHLHQLSSNEPNSNPTYSDLLASTHLTSFIQQQQQQQQQQQGGNHQQHKATTPVFDHLLMSPLFSSMLPSSGSCSNSSTTSSSSSSSSSQTSLNGQAAAAGNGVPASSSSSSSLLTCNSFGQAFANNAAAAAAISAAMGLNANANTNKTTPSSSPITIGGDLSKLISSNHCSSFKRTKDKQQNNNNIKNQKINGAVNKQINQTATSQINSSLINALRFDTNSNGSYDELVSITGSNTNNSQVAASNTNGGENATHLHHLMMLQQQQQQGVANKKISMSPSMGRSAHRPPSSLGGVDFSALASKVAAASSSTSGSTGPSSAANGVPLTGRNTPRIDDDSSGIVSAAKTGNSASNRLQNSSSPPPPPSIGKPVLNAATITSTSPTKLLQFYPFTSGSSSVVGGGVHVMHRPIPILQKPDSSSSTTTTTSNRSAPSVSIDEEVEEIAAESSLKSAAANRANSSSNSSSTTSAANNGSATTSKTPNELAAELIKIANSSQAQQHQSSNHIQQPSQQSLQQTNQLLSTLRSNSASNNSPLMFAINPNGACGSSNNFISFSSNSANLFASYPNISPANGMNGALIGGNCGGSASPTSSLFPSITSLFQSPIGTPRVTPTPQQYAAAYLFNDDQFHSLIYNTTSNQAASNSNGQTANNGCLVASNQNGAQQQEATSFIDAVATVQQTFHLANTADLSPLFNNLISAAVNAANNTNSSGSEQKTNNVLLSTTNN